MTKKVNRTELAAKLISMKAEYDKAVKEQSRPVLKEIFDAFFKSCPEAKVVTWVQGTPSFNDGDPCRFSVHDIYVGNDEDADIDSPEDEPSFASADNQPYVKTEYGDKTNDWKRTVTVLDEPGRAARQKIDDAAEPLYSNLQGLDDMMETAFGNGARIKVTRNKKGEADFDVEEYDVGY